jgi:hypothetical protein
MEVESSGLSTEGTERTSLKRQSWSKKIYSFEGIKTTPVNLV